MATAEPPTGSSVSYRRQYRRCGRPRCPTCGAPGAPGHGPYWYAYWWQEGRMRSHYVGKHLPDGVAHELPTAASPAEEAPRPAGLRVRSLGAFMVWRGEDAIPAGGWGRRKVALLFKCLLSAPGYRLHREELLERLWPEADPATAARNLSSTLHRLRGLLDTGSVSSSHVRLEGDVLTLHPSPGGPVGEDWLDAVAFARAAGVALAGSDPGACRAALARYGATTCPRSLTRTGCRRAGMSCGRSIWRCWSAWPC